MTIRDTDLSRAVSHALRRTLPIPSLSLDETGWALVDHLINALREKGGEWVSVDSFVLERVLSTSAKRRDELDGVRIRALDGHSLSGGIQQHLAGGAVGVDRGAAATDVAGGGFDDGPKRQLPMILMEASRL